MKELSLRLKAGDCRGLFGAAEQQQKTPDGRKLSKLGAEQDWGDWRSWPSPSMLHRRLNITAGDNGTTGSNGNSRDNETDSVKRVKKWRWRKRWEVVEVSLIDDSKTGEVNVCPLLKPKWTWVTVEGDEATWNRKERRKSFSFQLRIVNAMKERKDGEEIKILSSKKGTRGKKIGTNSCSWNGQTPTIK